MTKEKHVSRNKHRQSRRHPTSIRLIAGLLCICLSVMSLPGGTSSFLALAAEKKEVVTFPALPEEIRMQTAKPGTELEELELPDTLMAVCRFAGENYQGVKQLAQELSAQVRPKQDAVFVKSGNALSQENAESVERDMGASGGEASAIEQQGDEVQEAYGNGVSFPEETASGEEDSENSKEPDHSGEEAGDLEETASGEGESGNPDQEAPSEGEAELPAEPDQPQQEPGAGMERQQTELVTIEGITWSSQPEYDSETEGIYLFTPVLPESYRLAEGGRLPEITVEVVRSEKREARDGDDQGQESKKSAGEAKELEIEQSPVFAEPSMPGCGVISEDTTWKEGGVLENGELIVNPGVTLTIKGALTIQGSVTIKGGGTILRNGDSAGFYVGQDACLTMANITVDGNSYPASCSMIQVAKGEVNLEEGCRIQDCIYYSGRGGAISCQDDAIVTLNGAVIESCSAESGGAISITGSRCSLTLNGGAIESCSASTGGGIYANVPGMDNEINLNNARIENCSALGTGGGIYATLADVTIRGGTYKNNRTTGRLDWIEDIVGGGFVFICQAVLTIHSGNFIDNTTVTKGGCVHHCGHKNTTTNIYGGYFKGNTSSNEKYKGSGGVYNSTAVIANTDMTLSGNMQFCGDGDAQSGMDGVYLDSKEQIFRRIKISNTLSYPITLYLKASEGFVIAEGTNSYRLLHERDMKKINFVDSGDSGKKWYAVLDETNNQVYISETDPGYGYYLYYISNGADWTVVDDNRYEIGDTVQIKSADELKRDGFTFVEWNTEPDGTGAGYQPGDNLEIQGDTDLYAIFRDNAKKTLKANFYSGGAGQKETQTIETEAASSSGTVDAPELKTMEGWTPLGWNAAKDQYTGEIAPGEEITLTEDKDYYGIYQKPVRLIYEAKDAQSVPEALTRQCSANVHQEVSISMAQFTVADGAERPGYEFAGWNTKADGSGRTYKAGEALQAETDVTLYAMFQKTLHANFYSGDAGQKETKSVEVEASAESGTVEAPVLKTMEGWTPLGWNAAKDQYTGEIAPGEEITLTEDKDYYGTYQKTVNLSYVANGAQSIPEVESGQCHANVHGEITISPVKFTIAPPAVRLGYAFAGWNAKADGTGKTYKEGDVLETETDVTLYAIFKKPLHARFYSGSAGQNETLVVEIPEDAVSGTIEAPSLKELQLVSEGEKSEGLKQAAALEASDSGTSQNWKPLGWSVDPQGYNAEIQPGEEITLTDDGSYYGVYGKDVKVTYEAIGVEGFPYSQSGTCFGNVHQEFTKSLAEFVIEPGPERFGSAFVGWNTRVDGTGESYQEGEILRTEEDLTLYAVYQKTLTADFYSGSAGRKETKAVSLSGIETSGMVTAPELAQMEGWDPVGWTMEQDSYGGEIQQEQEISLTQDMAYYGVYEKRVTLSYEGQGKGETLSGHANVHEEVTYDWPVFTLAPAPERQGYRFAGWNEKEDGTGKSYPADSRQAFEQDMILYAAWTAADDTPYLVEHYKQDAEGDGYILEEADTEELVGTTDSVTIANPKKYAGFTENVRHEQRCGTGKIEADGSLVLRLFYDRDIYQVSFDLNGGMGKEPKRQTVRYGCPIEEVEEPVKKGYSFKGWYLDSAGTPECQWDFGGNVEENTSSLDVTLYAKWVDDIAPELGKATFRKGHTDLASWIIGQKGLAVTVPIIEEGSGAERAVYALMPEREEAKSKSAQALHNINAKAYGSISLPLGLVATGGGKTAKAKIRERDGKTVAEFTIDENFKGTIAMTCTDKAGNVSARKVLTSKGQGVIVEDNAPRIRFTAKGKAQAGASAVIEVNVEDETGENISGGIAGITYRIDNEKEREVKEKAFSKEIVESYRFTIEVTGAGIHTLSVEAKDNAGNWNGHKMTFAIPQQAQEPLPAEPQTPGPEPKTGDGAHVEIYATVSMIAGFTYLLMYFTTKEHGMTKQKKEELVSRLLCWAKGKGGIKRMLALAAIFLLLAYYHGIGKKGSAEWRKACER